MISTAYGNERNACERPVSSFSFIFLRTQNYTINEIEMTIERKSNEVNCAFLVALLPPNETNTSYWYMAMRLLILLMCILGMCFSLSGSTCPKHLRSSSTRGYCLCHSTIERIDKYHESRRFMEG